MRAPVLDYVLLATALAAAVGSWCWYGWPGRAHGRPHRDNRVRGKLAAAYISTESSGWGVSPGKWLAPSAQARGREWIYDMFTPPEIFYDMERRQFVASRPHAAPAVNVAGLELLAVQRTPFRLQLVGYVGGGHRYLGTFENQLTGEVFLAGTGRPVPALGLMITDFAVERRPVALMDQLNSIQWVATAIVRDERTGESTRLIAGERNYTAELHALLAADGEEDDSLQELRAGEEVKDGNQSYILSRLELDPPTAELTPIAPTDAAPPVRLSLAPRMSLESLVAKPAN